MSDIMERLSSILSVKKVLPEVDTVVVFEIGNNFFKFSYNPSLRIDKISTETLSKLDICKISLTEDTFIKILNKQTSQQDAYNDGLLSVQGSIEQLLEANFIIETLQNVFE